MADELDAGGISTTTETPETEFRDVPFVFNGKAIEYFGIWIVNLFLTIITLGIYSAWATVRTRRYLNGSLSLDDHSFGYHANPISILIGRLIVLVFFGVYTGVQYVNPILAGIFSIGLLFFIPWAINRSMRFNLRMTSYRNVRFGFKGRYWSAFGVFILWPIAGVFTLGILFPFAIRAGRQYITRNASYGGRPFELNLGVGPIYVAIIKTVLFAILLFILFGLAMAPFSTSFFGNLSGLENLGEGEELPQNFIMMILGFYIIAIPIFTALPAFFSALMTNIVAKNVKLDGHRMQANFNPFSFAWISVSNIVIVVLSLGLLYPWAIIRTRRYSAHHLTAKVEGDLDGYVTEVSDKTSALGDEMANAFDIEIGII